MVLFLNISRPREVPGSKSTDIGLAHYFEDVVLELTSGDPAGAASSVFSILFKGTETELLLILDVLSGEGGGQ